ncbi:MAG: hypothetical protein WCA54_16730 [Pseudolabrys sp.]
MFRDSGAPRRRRDPGAVLPASPDICARQALGLLIPPGILVAADEVLE